jgi:hypothetical protein
MIISISFKDTSDECITSIMDIDEACITSIITSINDPGDVVKLTTMIHNYDGVTDTGNARFAGVNETGNACNAGVVGTGDAPSETLTVQQSI